MCCSLSTMPIGPICAKQTLEQPPRAPHLVAVTCSSGLASCIRHQQPVKSPQALTVITGFRTKNTSLTARLWHIQEI